jgi:flagellar protein FliO/FliZ
MFNAATSERAGEWYLGVYCRKCQAPIPVFQDPGCGTAIAAGTGKLTVACPRCGKKGRYAAREVITFLVYADREAPADRAPVNDDHPIDRGRDTPISGSKMSEREPVLDLAPYEIPDSEPEPVLELETDAAPEADVEPALESDDPEPAPGTEAIAEPPVDESSAGDTPLELGPYEVSDESPDFEPDADPFVEASAGPEPTPTSELSPDAPGTAEPPTGDMPVSAAPVSEISVGDDHPIEHALPAAESEPVLELAPARPPDVDAAGELEAFFDASPVPDAAPVDTQPSAPEIAEGEHVDTPEPAPAHEPEQASASEPDAALELEAFFDASPIPEAAPAFEPHADVPAPPESLEPEPEPAPALELEPAPAAPTPATDVEVNQDAALELEAFFDSRPIPEPAPTVETQADVPQAAEQAASEAFAREALVSAPPVVEMPAAEIAPVAPAPVETAPAEPPPPPPIPAPPKPIAVIYRERWADPADRPRIIKELRPLIHGLKARAEAQRYDVLVRITDLFTDYLAEVAPERQSGAAIEQYIYAVFALSERGRARGTDRIGEEMAATLRALNRHAGLYTSR